MIILGGEQLICCFVVSMRETKLNKEMGIAFFQFIGFLVSMFPMTSSKLIISELLIWGLNVVYLHYYYIEVIQS